MKVDPITGILITLTHLCERVDLIYAYETDELKREQIKLIQADLNQVQSAFQQAFDPDPE